MRELFARTLSQGLQAFVPAAAYFAWVYGRRPPLLTSSARWAIAAAALLTIPAGYQFQRTALQAGWEAALSICTVGIALWFGHVVWSESRKGPSEASSFHIGIAAAALTLVVVRQTMEIEVVLEASLIQLRSFDATAATIGAVVAALIPAILWRHSASRLSREALHTATLVLIAVFFLQALLFAFHELTEAHLLPWSEILHAASEPLGPEGEYGRGISYLLVVLPILTVLLMPARKPMARLWLSTRRMAFTGALAIAAACALLMVADIAVARFRLDSAAPQALATVQRLASAPHILSRHAGVNANYNVMTIAPLDRPAAGVPTGLRCERLSSGGGRGICLQGDRGVFTTYNAVFFDRTLKPSGSMKLDGSPSRTRVSLDGRVGALTVFVSGHAYSTAGFSTKTVLLDMASGDELGDLEEFSTWRNGARFKADDFNFWGVTFTKDSNVFYASLGTGGKTYLVRGELGLRKMTLVHDNVECPSISPDNRLIVFKRRVASTAGAWRLHVLNLATMTARPIAAETHYVDDQAEWLDNGHVLYAIQRPLSATSDVWMAPIEGKGPATIFLAAADSPVVVR